MTPVLRVSVTTEQSLYQVHLASDRPPNKDLVRQQAQRQLFRLSLEQN